MHETSIGCLISVCEVEITWHGSIGIDNATLEISATPRKHYVTVDRRVTHSAYQHW